MELSVKLHPKNEFPLGGALIKSASLLVWIKEIQLLSLSLNEIEVYPIPNDKPNQLWGCLVCFRLTNATKLGMHEACQKVTDNLFIPEKSILAPQPTLSELNKLFSSGKHVIHPSFGLVELGEPLDFSVLVETPIEKAIKITKLTPFAKPPRTVRSFLVSPVSPEEVMKNLEEKVFPNQQVLPNKPLTFFEKGKLEFYRIFFKKEPNHGETGTSVQTTPTGSLVDTILNFFSGKNKATERFQQDYADLEKRNQSRLDKLMDLFKSNPDEALKYAIPLDPNGTVRGGTNKRFDLSKRWFDFSIFSKNPGSSSTSGSIDFGNRFNEIQQQYLATADDLLKRQEYGKAAFVYLKLLRNHFKAAEALEAGKFYQEAAMIHLKHTGNKLRAANCYEKGNLTLEAIELYKALNENEKVGDLYTSIRKPKDAAIYYEKVIDAYKVNSQFLKASLVYKNKMNDNAAGQTLLLDGWRSNKDAVNCLSAYFSSIDDVEQLRKKIHSIYSDEITDKNRESFLHVIKNQYTKKNELRDSLKEMAYETIAKQIPSDPSIVTELRAFDPSNKELIKDTLRFKLNRKNRAE
jgi:tetratricopeptide (TPR) repeat protein